MENKHNKTIGKWGEEKAAEYLLLKGYKILCRNWRCHNWEVDIIAAQNEILHFVEVKTRTSTKYGLPETAVSTSKMKYLQAAADEFLHQYPEWTKIQFDVIAILKRDIDIQILFNEDVYF